MKVYAVIVAAGRSERFGGAVPKQFREVCGRPLLSWTISRFEKAASVDKIVLVVSEDNLLYTFHKVVDPYKYTKLEKIVIGGEKRSQSVINGLKALPLSTDIVAIHDGARPLVLPADIDEVVNLAKTRKAAMLAVPATDTIKRVKDGYIITTLEREALYYAQTPQVFQYDLIVSAHEHNTMGNHITDDAMLVEAMGFMVQVVVPRSVNIKVTTPEDLIMVEALLEREIHE
ncbi:MAG: 2-C-methyl-D-erythritol 4-phosphate cytidylyltransferase [candidate division Zixibacteria bacterium]|nr:2-C-methyl-D-erythritol 4-phosphate cytidylyltransferase [candidate division Zixibacteria bacterium]MDD5425112.1 2-C-methyl-D-erythritol 4-phosphate cytidylyltransferase [candidate division Zixibacteria bacterium]